MEGGDTLDMRRLGSFAYHHQDLPATFNGLSPGDINIDTDRRDGTSQDQKIIGIWRMRQFGSIYPSPWRCGTIDHRTFGWSLRRQESPNHGVVTMTTVIAVLSITPFKVLQPNPAVCEIGFLSTECMNISYSYKTIVLMAGLSENHVQVAL